MCWNCGFGYRQIQCPACKWTGVDSQLYEGGVFEDETAVDRFPDLDGPHCPECGFVYEAEGLEPWLANGLVLIRAAVERKQLLFRHDFKE